MKVLEAIEAVRSINGVYDIFSTMILGRMDIPNIQFFLPLFRLFDMLSMMSFSFFLF